MCKLSIVIPAFNAQDFIETTLDSICSQVFERDKIEIIIVDDGSEDGTKEICKDYLTKSHVVIKYFFKKNGGLGDARNYGIHKSSGKYIWFFDADDIIGFDAISKLNLLLDEDYDLVGFGAEEIYSNSGLVRVVNSKNKPINKTVTGYEYVNEYSLAHSACFFIVRKNLLIENNIYFLEDVLSEDFDFELRLFEKCKKIYHLNWVCYKYIIRKGSLSRRKNDEYYYFHHKSMLKIIDNLNNSLLDRDYRFVVNTYVVRIKLIAIVNLINSTIPYVKKVDFYRKFNSLSMFNVDGVRFWKLGNKHKFLLFFVYLRLIRFILFFKK